MSSDQSGALAGAGTPPPGSNAVADDAAENFVQIVDVVKKFGETVAVKQVNLSVEEGRTVRAARQFRLRQVDACCACWPGSKP